MIQKLIEKLNKKRLKERISSAIVMVALIVSRLLAFPVLWEPYPELWSATAIIMH